MELPHIILYHFARRTHTKGKLLIFTSLIAYKIKISLSISDWIFILILFNFPSQYYSLSLKIIYLAFFYFFYLIHDFNISCRIFQFFLKIIYFIAYMLSFTTTNILFFPLITKMIQFIKFFNLFFFRFPLQIRFFHYFIKKSFRLLRLFLILASNPSLFLFTLSHFFVLFHLFIFLMLFSWFISTLCSLALGGVKKCNKTPSRIL